MTLFLMSHKNQPVDDDGSAASGSSGGVAAFLRDLFLPNGYPDSVAPEYAAFQAYDTLQGLCSYLRGVLSTAAILQGLGVGSAAASALAATQQTVVRDACGMLGSLLFAWRYAGAFDRDVKQWRLFADVSNDVGLTLDLLAPLAGTALQHVRGVPETVLGLPAGKAGFLACVCLGTVFKAWCGVAAGATRVTITEHFARRGNLADVAAKEGSQETAVTLLGMACGWLLAGAVNGRPLAAWAAFLALTLVHVVANYRAVRALALRTLNRGRHVPIFCIVCLCLPHSLVPVIHKKLVRWMTRLRATQRAPLTRPPGAPGALIPTAC